MSLEDLTGTDKGLDDLVITNPDGLDPKSEGDNHIRGLKNVLLNVFGPMLSRLTSLPAVGDVLTWDGAKYEPTALPVPAVPSTPTVQVFTASGTYNKPAGMKWCRVYIKGGGASGGSSTLATAYGGGGGEGTEGWRIFAEGALFAAENVVIGGGGAAVAAGLSAPGNNGGATTFSAGGTMIAPGGIGGTQGNFGGAAGAGGAPATNCQWFMPGAPGQAGAVASTGVAINAYGGGKGGGQPSGGPASNNCGAGGGPGSNIAASGPGAGGLCVVEEFYA